jgi:hypothetical protein
VLFYAALHFVEAGFATLNVHNRSHRARDDAMSKESQFDAVIGQYRQLPDDSENARYGLWRPRSHEVDQDVRYYAQLVAHLRAGLGL